MSHHGDKVTVWWKLPVAFVWQLPFAAAALLVLAYTILHILLGVPLHRIISPYLAFTALTVAMVIFDVWASRFGARVKSGLPIFCVYIAFGLGFFALWAHHALALGIGKPKAIVGGAWTGAVLWCLGVFLGMLLKRRKRLG